MEILFTKHALRKQEILKDLGWYVDLDAVRSAIQQPDFQGQTKSGQKFALKSLDSNHQLRVVYKIEGDIIKVITFHVTVKGRYER